MKKEIQDQLQSIFTKHDQKREQAAVAKSEKETREAAFVKAFAEKRESVVRLAMMSIGRFIKEKGYDFKIITEEDGYHHTSKKSVQASISFHIFIGDQRVTSPRPSEFPHLRVYCDKVSQKVGFHESTMSPGRGGRSGAAGEVPLSELTEDLIHQKVTAILAEVLR